MSVCPRCAAPLTDAVEGLCPSCLLAAALPLETSAHGRFVPPSPEQLAGLLPGYRVEALIGHGGMGAVYRALQIKLDRPVAIKVLPPAVAAEPGFAERFAREARTLAKLSHPNIVAVHDFGDADGMYYLVMEFVEGVNLRQAMTDGRLTPARALAVVGELCDALHFAHARGVVHRDVKPENVLIDRFGRVKMADFGLAKLTEPSATRLTGTAQAMGTPHYMAPEQWERPADVDHRADIYSLGCCSTNC